MAKQETYTFEPDFVSPPGDTLLELLEERRISQSELARRMGRPIKTINEIIRGRTVIMPETALQLERVLRTPARFWLKREQLYREHLARRAANKVLQAQQGWLLHFPIQQMQRCGWLPTDVEGVHLLVALLQFFGIAEPESWEDIWSDSLVNYRKAEAYESSDYALSVWLRQGEIEADEVQCAPYNKTAFKQLLKKEIRALTCLPPEQFQPQLVELCATVGVAVVFVPQVAGTQVSGAAYWLMKDKALIQLSLHYNTNDQFWFTFFHEAGHILRHGKREVFIDIKSEDSNKKEREADRFAEDMLIPARDYAAFVRRNKEMSQTIVSDFAQEVGIAPGIVVGRLQQNGDLPDTELNELKEEFAWVEPC